VTPVFSEEILLLDEAIMSQPFIHDDFLLSNEIAGRLYHDCAAKLPIIDYHNHLSPKDIAKDRHYENLTQLWLDEDHYKWRAMRSNGIRERYITGKGEDEEKFHAWAETVPYTLRNPLYHWTHLELSRWFGIDDLLSPETAEQIYLETQEKLLSDDYSAQNLLRRANVTHLCTTDDPAASLKHHIKLHQDEFEIKVLPGWRPDRALGAHDPRSYNRYLDKLSERARHDINSYDDLVNVLADRHDYFAEQGCCLADYGLETPTMRNFKYGEVFNIFDMVRSGTSLDKSELAKLRSALLLELARMDDEKGWVQQYHIGPIRNTNSRMFEKLGADSGFDSIGDSELARPLSRLLDKLNNEELLGKTILYNINPSDNYLFASMIGNFQDGKSAGKIQWGSAWWFLDQKEGIKWHLNALSNLGLLRRFIGMLTDSRSILSLSRHEYFRRILCDVIGRDVLAGELPNDEAMLAAMVREICYDNAYAYFGFDDTGASQ
jgi:glucuronate isomerase